MQNREAIRPISGEQDDTLLGTVADGGGRTIHKDFEL